MIRNSIRSLMFSIVLALGAFAAASSHAQDYPPSSPRRIARMPTGRTIKNARQKNF